MHYIETMTDAEKAIAEFLAKGGKVQKLADDASNNVSTIHHGTHHNSLQR